MNQRQKAILCDMIMEAIRSGDLVLVVETPAGPRRVDGYGFNKDDGHGDDPIKFTISNIEKDAPRLNARFKATT